ncbi:MULTISPECIES: alpha/beta hydrolase [unclassified Streptomyces]|uniref:alpha/beta hydrolase n=1 Tax=unclassified Streptomyces TaxID=2593676 RepID=UPI0022B72AF4|nr:MULTISPECIES: alpha/beta hydrolase [unclassified Streptomyces]MCZ7416671.1 alpha/beta hydrolase [Streptomyces sp. WMMC897]MCZ7433519.1 alpha/beta hydrolase [Streptomyces sp. WMMC1477]
MTERVRRGSTVAAAILLTAGLAGTSGCGGGSGAPDGRSTPQAAGQSPSPPPAPELPSSLTGQHLDWRACPPAPAYGGGAEPREPEPLPDGTEWRCASMKAPLDYDDPDGETIEVALVRAASAAEGEDRIGSLIFNFGGPGGSGVATLPVSGAEFAQFHERYDLVSFDPRGVARTAGVRCLSDAELDAYHQEATLPTGPSEEETYLDQQADYARACAKSSGPILDHLRTTDTARDLDLMRQVLGDDRLYYFGISYGTELGGVYAHLYPRRVGRAVFDSVVDPTLDPAESALNQTKGFQLALTNYLKACDQTGECPVGETPAQGEQEIVDLLDQLEKDPLPTNDPDGRELNSSLAAAGIALSLYSQEFWPVLTEGLEDALNDGDGTLLLRLSDLLNGRREDGTYDNSQAALTAISCADTKPRYTLEDVRERLPDFTEASPVFGAYSAWGLVSCHEWPVDGAWERPTVSAPEAAPIVLVGITGDPATPYEGAARMADQLGGDAVVLTYRGEGHGAYNSGDPCVQRQVNEYLLKGKVPEDGAECGGE